MDAPAIPTSGFFRHELNTALAENGYALMAWEVLETEGGDGDTGQAAQARAKVELLPESEAEGDRGRTVEVQLTLRGYQVEQRSESTACYETLDDLLSNISPAYLRRRQTLLFAKLEDVAKDRSWHVQEQEQDDEDRKTEPSHDKQSPTESH